MFVAKRETGCCYEPCHILLSQTCLKLTENRWIKIGKVGIEAASPEGFSDEQVEIDVDGIIEANAALIESTEAIESLAETATGAVSTATRFIEISDHRVHPDDKRIITSSLSAHESRANLYISYANSGEDDDSQNAQGTAASDKGNLSGNLL